MAFAVTVPSGDFAKKVATVARALPARGVTPALAGILLRAEGDTLALAATDLELAIRTSLPTIPEGEGVVLVPGRLLADVVRALPSGDVTLKLDEERSEVVVTAGKATYRLHTLLAEDFPRLPEADGDSFTVARSTLLGAVERVSFAASQDVSRPIMCGVQVRIADGTLTVAATDSYRLAVFETDIDELADFDAVIPARALTELGRIVTGDEVRVTTDGSRIVFDADGSTLSARLIDGQFPDYQRLFPDTFEYELEADRKRLAAVVRRMAIMAHGTTPVRLKFTSKRVTVSARTADVGEAKEDLSVPFQGEPVEIGFNPAYLASGLEAADGEKVAVKMIGALRPVVIGEGAFRYLVMPVRLTD